MVDEVASVSEETTAESETVAAAAEEQTATISNVNDDVRRLSEQATDLQSMLAAFTVESDQQARATVTPQASPGTAAYSSPDPSERASGLSVTASSGVSCCCMDCSLSSFSVTASAASPSGESEGAGPSSMYSRR